MISASKPANELERLAALYEYNLLDTLPEKEYDDITRIAADICSVPMSALTIVDAERQWFKSKIGITDTENSRDVAFCAHAILNPNEIFVVDNPSEDERFHDNPLVTGKPNIAFYAGIPLVTESGAALGTLCVLDNKPNQLSFDQKVTLMALARQIVAYFEVRKLNIRLHQQQEQLRMVNEDLAKFAYVVAHDIKSPFSTIAMGLALLKDKYMEQLDEEGRMFLDMMEERSLLGIQMVNGILEHTQSFNKDSIAMESFTLGSLIEETRKLLTIPARFEIQVKDPDMELFSSKSVLLQILANLCNNAIKYNDKAEGKITISATEQNGRYHFAVQDNGPGIAEADQQKIFELFSTLNVSDRFNNKGTGIGLSTVKRLVEKMEGAVTVTSAMGSGSNFEFTIKH